MTDLDLLVAGAMITFIAVSGAYIAIRHRANETPVDSYKDHVSRSATARPARQTNGAGHTTHRPSELN